YPRALPVAPTDTSSYSSLLLKKTRFDLLKIVAGGMVFGVADNGDPTAITQYCGSFGNTLNGVIGSLGVNMRLQFQEQSVNRPIVKDDDSVHRLERGNQLGPLFFRH